MTTADSASNICDASSRVRSLNIDKDRWQWDKVVQAYHDGNQSV
ncbi:hypothetical protein [Moritella sp.]|nr:hypothetical protein [Moritella sp.]